VSGSHETAEPDRSPALAVRWLVGFGWEIEQFVQTLDLTEREVRTNLLSRMLAVAEGASVSPV
jgi:hypothetical protein